MNNHDLKLLKKVGEGIRRERDRNGLTQAQLAEEASLHPNFIGQIERGEKAATVTSLHKICTALGIGVGDFFDQIGL
ncbi:MULTISPECIES: helix-turn-helix domain-containing protein [Brevibacillus]|uniref:helix-turn-helix domain-containing protein n=1 Tax=Brevibacillus TaxID=55080 RepID=UPI00257BE9B4|nr:helix-turn-helix transcriptional regulator [Brevibacillus sp.]